MNEIILEAADGSREWLLSEDETPDGSKTVVGVYVKVKGEEDWEYVRSYASFDEARDAVAGELAGARNV